jgi:hypothetical protein
MSTVTFALMTQDGHSHAYTLTAAIGPEWQRKWCVIDEGVVGLGVHVYFRSLPNGDTQLGVRFSNGCTRSDGTGFKGRLYYSSLTLQVDGVTIRVVSDGLHCFPPRAILERRYTIHGGQAVRGWDYGDVSIPSPAPAFGPAREALPPVDRTHYAQAFETMNLQLHGALEAGTKLTLYPWGTNGPAPAIDLRTDALGPWMPDGYPEAGAPAGYGIDLAFGWSQTTEELDFASMAHECAMDRNPVAAYDIDTGAQITCTDWANNYLAHGQLVGSKLELPAFLQGTYGQFFYANANQGSSPYQAALEGYQPDNSEHVVRAMRRACALVGWANDPMALDDLTALFEYHRTLWFGDRADDKTHASDGSYVPPSLSALSYFVALNGPHGAPVLRSFGWMMTLGAWANAPKTWAQKAIDTYLGMCDKFGIPQREAHTPYIPAGWLGTQHFHSAYIHHGAWTLSRAAGWRESDVLAMIDRWRSYVLNARGMPLQERPDGPGSFGPPKWIFTQGPQGEVPQLTTASTSGGGFQEGVLAVLGHGAQSALETNAAAGGLGHDEVTQRMLTSGLGVDLPAARIGAKLTQMRSHTGDQQGFAAYWAALEATT